MANLNNNMDAIYMEAVLNTLSALLKKSGDMAEAILQIFTDYKANKEMYEGLGISSSKKLFEISGLDAEKTKALLLYSGCTDFVESYDPSTQSSLYGISKENVDELYQIALTINKKELNIDNIVLEMKEKYQDFFISKKTNENELEISSEEEIKIEEDKEELQLEIDYGYEKIINENAEIIKNNENHNTINDLNIVPTIPFDDINNEDLNIEEFFNNQSVNNVKNNEDIFNEHEFENPELFDAQLHENIDLDKKNTISNNINEEKEEILLNNTIDEISFINNDEDIERNIIQESINNNIIDDLSNETNKNDENIINENLKITEDYFENDYEEHFRDNQIEQNPESNKEKNYEQITQELNSNNEIILSDNFSSDNYYNKNINQENNNDAYLVKNEYESHDITNSQNQEEKIKANNLIENSNNNTEFDNSVHTAESYNQQKHFEYEKNYYNSKNNSNQILQEDTYKQNYHNEKIQQENIIKRIEEEKIKNETAHVSLVGNGADIKETNTSSFSTSYKNSEHNSNNDSKSGYNNSFNNDVKNNVKNDVNNTTKNNSNDNVSNYSNSNSNNNSTVRINQVILNASHSRNNDHQFSQTVGKNVSKMTETFKDSAVYEGYRKVADLTSFVGASALATSVRESNVKMLDKLAKKENKGEFARLNIVLQNQMVKGMVGVDSHGKPLLGLDFSTRDKAAVSQHALFSHLQNVGLASYRGKNIGKEILNGRNLNANWDLTKFQRLYMMGSFDKLAKILKFDKLDQSTRIALLQNIYDISRMQNTFRKPANVLKSAKARRLQMITKKLAQDSATYEGYTQVSKTVRTVRKTYSTVKMSTKGLGKGLSYVVVKPLRKHVIDPKLNKSELGRKILNKETKLQQFRERSKERKKTKIVKKADRQMGLHITKRKLIEKGKSKIISKVNLASVKVLGNGKRQRIVRGAAKAILKPFKVTNVAIKAIKNVLSKVIGTFVSIKKWLFIGIGGAALIIVILNVLISIITAIVSTVMAFFGFDEDINVKDVYSSQAGQVTLNLIDMESTWMNGLMDIADDDNFKLSDIKYGNMYSDIAFYANNMLNTTYDTNNQALLGPNPFGNIQAPNEARKLINNIDGGVEIQYINASGGITRTSNIKEILAMCATYFENDVDLSKFNENTLKNMSPNDFKMNELKMGTKDLNSSWIIQPGWTFGQEFDAINIMSEYCTALFNISHQEQFDINLFILPTQKQVDEYRITVNENTVLCPDTEHNGYGCMEYNKFYYSNGKISLLTNDGLHAVNQYVAPINSGDDCTADDLEEFYSSIANGHSECWNITYFTHSHWGPKYEVPYSRFEAPIDFTEVLTYPDKEIRDNREVLLYDHSVSDPYLVSQFSAAIREMAPDSYNTILVKKVGNEYWVRYRTQTKHQQNSWKMIEGKESVIYAQDQYLDYIMKFTHNCKGNHTGYYCGGHIKLNVIGKIYGFTDTQLGNQEGDIGTIIGKVADNTYIHKEVTGIEVDQYKLKTMKDIFDADSALRRAYEPLNWTGWTKQNMEMAVLKYNQDWKELYDLILSTNLGGEKITQETADFIKTYITSYNNNYNNISTEKINAIENAMHLVGMIGYNENHHNCKIGEECQITKNGRACYYTDSSGFISYLFKDRLNNNIYGINQFYELYGDTSLWKKATDTSLRPGDLIFYLPGGIGGNDDTVSIYLGYFYIGNVCGDWCIECTTMNGIGNVYLKKIGNKNECYILRF